MTGISFSFWVLRMDGEILDHVVMKSQEDDATFQQRIRRKDFENDPDSENLFYKQNQGLCWERFLYKTDLVDETVDDDLV